MGDVLEPRRAFATETTSQVNILPRRLHASVTRTAGLPNFSSLVRIPMKPAIDSDLKPASHSDFIPAGIPI